MNHPGLMFLLFVGSLLTVNSLPQNIAENIDSSQLPQQDINTLNCFNLVEESQWSEVLELDQVTATLSLRVQRAGQPVVTCLARQTVQYIISVVGDIQSQPFLLSDLHSWSGSSEQLVQHPPVFQYLIYPGNYRLRVTHCGADQSDGDECSQDTTTVFSQFLSVQQSSSSSSSCSSSSLSSNTSLVSVQSPSLLSGHSAVFHFSFDPCTQIQEYDRANISLFTAQLPGDCGQDSPQLVDQVLVTRAGDLASVQYHSPELPGDSFYCLSVSLSHISCRLATVPTPKYCYLQSEPLWLPQAPIISFLLPLCSDHLACAWLYIVVGAGSCLLVSCVLAVCCVSCCDKCRSSSSRKHDEVDFSGDVISLAPLHEKISWSDLHKEWDTREDKARGKILLLFSPDTKLFKELQEAFKSFLDLACHCDIYDLFDDALFDTIALDPSEWLQEFVNDEDVKILVISSAGEFDKFCSIFKLNELFSQPQLINKPLNFYFPFLPATI